MVESVIGCFVRLTFTNLTRNCYLQTGVKARIATFQLYGVTATCSLQIFIGPLKSENICPFCPILFNYVQFCPFFVSIFIRNSQFSAIAPARLICAKFIKCTIACLYKYNMEFLQYTCSMEFCTEKTGPTKTDISIHTNVYTVLEPVEYKLLIPIIVIY